MQHRKDIEGLRAVAILLVVAAHAGLPGLAGGFIGVDVFFVLSGYLITGLLLTEHARHGRLDFKAFYARRFRRLLPALALMLLTTSWLASQLLPSHEQARHAQDGITAALWLSNVHFVSTNIDYFSEHTSVYLHTWSLGVEEQFYLIWPALLAFVLTSRDSALTRTRWMLAALILISLTACIWLSWTSTMLAFYMMPMRIWQFASGALVLIHTQQSSTSHPSLQHGIARKLSTSFAAPLGIALILSTAACLNGQDRYPGLWAIPPTLGTCFLLIVGSRHANSGLIISGLSLPPMQWLGRMSYGWYLWHWPLLLLGASVFDMTSGWTRAGLVTLALLIAWLSYHLIEQPIRRTRNWPLSAAKTILIALGVMICIAAALLRWQASALSAPSEPISNRRGQTPKIYGMGCDSWHQDANLLPCVFGPDTGQAHVTLVVIGDSIGLQWFPAFANLAERHQWRLVVLTKSACPMVDEPIYYQRIGRDYSECTQWRAKALEYLKELQPDAIVMGSSQDYDFSPEQWLQGTKRILEALSGASRHLGILRATPALPISGETCVSTSTPLRDWLIQATRCSGSASNARDESIADALKNAAQAFPDTHLIDMNDAVCPEGTCQAEQHGLLVFRDTRHLNAPFVETMADELEKRIKVGMSELFE